MHDKFSNFLFKLLHLCQMMSTFSYREVAQGRLENIGPSLEGADVTNSQARRPSYKKDPWKKHFLSAQCTINFQIFVQTSSFMSDDVNIFIS